jgi:hypothetical protein
MALDKLTLPSKTVGESDSEYGQKYKDALSRLTASLDARENLNYNPTLLAISQGLLSPTATGSFGESLGNVAGSVLKSQESESKRGIENAQMRMQLAQAGMEQEQAQQARKQFGSMLTPQAPVGAVPPVGAAVGAAEGATQAPVRDITMQDAMRFASANPNAKQQIDLLIAAAKQGSERFKVAMNGTVFDTQTGKYVNIPVPGQTQSKFTIPGIGEVSMTPSQYSEYEDARSKGQGQQWLKDFASPEGKGFGTTPSTLKTVGATEAEAAAQKARSEHLAKGEATREEAFKQSGQTGYETINIANRIAQTVTQNPNAFGKFATPGFVSSLGGLISQGVNVAGYQVSIPEVEAALIKADPNITQADLNARTMAAGDLANLELDFTRKFLQGQGQVTEGERKIVRSVGSSISDRPELIAMKAKSVARRSQFDVDAADAFSKFNEETGKGLDAFKRQDPNYKKLKSEYEDWISQTFKTPKAQVTTSAVPTGGITADSLRALLQPRTR